MNNESLFKEIDLIQDVVKRMANNSFLIKGWTITLVVVTMLFDGKSNYIVLGLIPVIMFWFLDSYYLRQEKLYRALYKWVISNRKKTDEFLFDLSTKRFENEVDSTLKDMFSITLIWFYPLILILIIGVSCILQTKTVG